MRKSLMATLAAALLVMPVAAQDELASMRRAHAEAKAAPAPTLTERYGPDDLRHGTLRLPVGTSGKGPFPTVLLIHGGCWTKGFDTRAGMEAMSAALAARGFAVWNVEYRMLGEPGAGWPGTFEDIAAAEDHLTKLAKRYPLDLKRLTVVGHSAGAHLALWAASRPRLPAPWNAGTLRPASVVAIDGPRALVPFVGIDQQVCGAPVIGRLMGGSPAEKPAEYRLASPADQLPLGVRTLLVEGSLGFAVRDYATAARAKGEHVEVLAPAGADHFDIVTPSTANGAKVIDFIASRAVATR